MNVINASKPAMQAWCPPALTSRYKTPGIPLKGRVSFRHSMRLVTNLCCCDIDISTSGNISLIERQLGCSPLLNQSRANNNCTPFVHFLIRWFQIVRNFCNCICITWLRHRESRSIKQWSYDVNLIYWELQPVVWMFDRWFQWKGTAILYPDHFSSSMQHHKFYTDRWLCVDQLFGCTQHAFFLSMPESWGDRWCLIDNQCPETLRCQIRQHKCWGLFTRFLLYCGGLFSFVRFSHKHVLPLRDAATGCIYQVTTEDNSNLGNIIREQTVVEEAKPHASSSGNTLTWINIMLTLKPGGVPQGNRPTGSTYQSATQEL